MDDGGRNSVAGGMVIDVSAFPLEKDLLRIELLMRSKYSLDVSFHRRSDSNIKL